MKLILTCRIFLLLWERSRGWCRHRGNSDLRRRPFQSDEWQARFHPVHWIHSQDCSKQRQNQVLSQWLSSSTPRGKDCLVSGNLLCWLAQASKIIWVPLFTFAIASARKQPCTTICHNTSYQQRLCKAVMYRLIIYAIEAFAKQKIKTTEAIRFVVVRTAFTRSRIMTIVRRRCRPQLSTIYLRIVLEIWGTNTRQSTEKFKIFLEFTLPIIGTNYAKSREGPISAIPKNKDDHCVGGPRRERFAQKYITWQTAPIIPCQLWMSTHIAGTYLDYRTVIFIELVKSHHLTCHLWEVSPNINTITHKQVWPVTWYSKHENIGESTLNISLNYTFRCFRCS